MKMSLDLLITQIHECYIEIWRYAADVFKKNGVLDGMDFLSHFLCLMIDPTVLLISKFLLCLCLYMSFSYLFQFLILLSSKFCGNGFSSIFVNISGCWFALAGGGTETFQMHGAMDMGFMEVEIFSRSMLERRHHMLTAILLLIREYVIYFNMHTQLWRPMFDSWDYD